MLWAFGLAGLELGIMANVVVTGGAGFIGSHLCKNLLEEGNKVICVDSFVTGQKKNVEDLLENKSFSLVEHDITKPLKLSEPVDRIYNLASPASPKDFSRIPVEIMLTNSSGLKNMLDFALEKNARILQASTSEVYGNPLEHPQKETYFGNVNPVGERSCYDESKRFAEALIMSYGRKTRLDYRIVRIFNTYGPGMRPDDGRVVPSFICSALENKPLTVFGKGEQTRSFCFVSDLVDGIVKLMESGYKKPVNIGNPNEMTILELAELVKKLSGSKSEISFKPILEDDPERRKPDISVAKKELKWEPKVDVQDGLKRTIEWFRGL